ncbi:DUF3237 domain-containing protein [Solimonas fluminis]|uniref:DUF3237 domain-containing protein n=1 Tax=Solimonas fluminis TaxID=2086571 RepID=A0A2S5THD3_9GAMM|nr:DUF3237 domain-containing protein [Solimonas fluminis]PPE74357.1 DUF3237 domain-containing protein [Solimonas fluminis]
MNDLSLRGERLFTMDATLQAPPEVIGPVPEGVRINFHVTGGRFEGPRLRGRLRAVGQDAFLLRRDGIGLLEVLLTLETEDGALIDMRYDGQGDFGEEAYERFLRGEIPPDVHLHTFPRLRTAHPAYQWLQRRACVGRGHADLVRSTVRYDIYALG